MSARAGAVLGAIVLTALLGIPALQAQTAVIGFEKNVYAVTEGQSVALRLLRGGRTDVAATVSLVASGSAVAGTHYTVDGRNASPFLVQFAAGQVAKEVVFAVVDDKVHTTRSLRLKVEPAAPAVAGPYVEAVVSIQDNDAAAFIGFESEVFAAREGDSHAHVSVVRTGDLGGTTSVRLATGSGSALAGSDFDAVTTTVVFSPGETREIVPIALRNDAVYEPEESFHVTLSSVENGALTVTNAIVRITDDDPATWVGFDAESTTVSENGSPAVITIRRSGPLAETSAVSYRANVSTYWYYNWPTATNHVDYLPAEGTVVFAPGETTKTFTVAILDDLYYESTEAIPLELFSPVNAALSRRESRILIADNDASSLGVFVPDARVVAESASSVSVDIVRTGDPSALLTFDLRVESPSNERAATPGVDFTLPSGAVTLLPGERTKTIALTVVDDDAYEGSEAFDLILVPAAAQNNGGVFRSRARVTILDDDPPSFLHFTSPAFPTPEGAGRVRIGVSRTGDTTRRASVRYTTPNLWWYVAVPSTDYVPTEGTLTFEPGESEKSFDVTLVDDSQFEPTEQFGVELSRAEGALLTLDRAVVTIIDDDQSDQRLQFLPAAYRVAESAASVKLTLYRKDSRSAETFLFRTSDGSARAGLDYVPLSGTIDFAAGEESRTIAISIVDDSAGEGEESFNVAVSSSTGAWAANASVAVVDDDGGSALRVAVDAANVVEGDRGFTEAIFTVSLATPPPYSLTLTYRTTTQGTATPASDYLQASGTVTFQPGETRKNIAVIVLGDTDPEADETISMRITQEVYDYYYYPPRVVEIASAFCVIRNDDPAFNVSDISVTEGNSGTTPAVFTVTLTPPRSTESRVSYFTSHGSAGSADFIARSGELTFAPGETRKEVAVEVFGDTIPEADEMFGLRLADAVGAPIGRGAGLATIVNDDDSTASTKGIEYARVDGTPLFLDLFIPSAGPGPHPVVIWIHGDHWIAGSRFPSPAMRLVPKGYAVASVDFRTADVAPFPAAIHDLKAAVRWLRANAESYNLDRERIAAWGFGSGGHLAALLGTSGGVASLEDLGMGHREQPSHVRAAINWSGPADLPQLQTDALPCSSINHHSSGSNVSLFLGCALQFCGDKARQASPAAYVTRDDPPFLLVHGANDCEVSPAQSESFARQLQVARVDVTLRIEPGMGHTPPSMIDPVSLLAEVDRFLESKLKAAPVVRRRSSGR